MKRLRIRKAALERIIEDAQEMLLNIKKLTVNKNYISQVADKVASCKIYVADTLEDSSEEEVN